MRHSEDAPIGTVDDTGGTGMLYAGNGLLLVGLVLVLHVSVSIELAETY